MIPEYRIEMRPRRAHWRRQKYGPDRCMHKRIRIEESFVPVRVRVLPNLELPF